MGITVAPVEVQAATTLQKRTLHRITGFKERDERARDEKQSLFNTVKTPNGFRNEEWKEEARGFKMKGPAKIRWDERQLGLGDASVIPQASPSLTPPSTRSHGLHSLSARPRALSDHNMSLEPPTYLSSLQNNIRARPIPWEGAVRAGNITDDHLKRIKAVDKVRKEHRTQTIEADLPGYTSLLAGGSQGQSVLESASRRTDIVQYILVLASDLIQGKSHAAGQRSAMRDLADTLVPHQQTFPRSLTPSLRTRNRTSHSCRSCTILQMPKILSRCSHPPS